MEIFHSKLEEAEKTASAKEDRRRERWRKPAYSEKAQSGQESRKSDLIQSNKSSRDRYSSTGITGNEDKFRGDEKDNRSGSSETYRRDFNSRQNREFSSLGNLRPKFLRPSDDEELSFHCKSRNFEPSGSSSALSTKGSVHCGFQKPTENRAESLSSQVRSDERGERKHSNQKPLETCCSVDYGHISEDAREKSQNESLKDDSLKKEYLQNTRSSFAGYFVICFLN